MLNTLRTDAGPTRQAARGVKSLVDRGVALVSLILLAPLLIGIALAVRLGSPGPALFRQVRLGRDRQPFVVLKFRTMYAHSEVDGDVTAADDDDPRITPIGRLLRESNLDELPQLLNVLCGEMSLIGPRPHAVQHDHAFEREAADYVLRHAAKPGITGWAQVNGHCGRLEDTSALLGRLEHDLYYIRHWSLRLDLRIVFMTLRTGLRVRPASTPYPASPSIQQNQAIQRTPGSASMTLSNP